MLLLCIFFIMSKFFEFAILQTIYFIRNFLVFFIVLLFCKNILYIREIGSLTMEWLYFSLACHLSLDFTIVVFAM